MKFPDLVHAVKPEPHHAMPQAASAHDTFWDFVSLMPEIDAHADVGDVRPRDPAQLPHDAGLRRAHLPARQRRGRVDASASSTGRRVAGTHSLVWDEAVKINGADPDFHRRDLWEAIEAGAYPGVRARPAGLHRGAGRAASASTCSTRPRSCPRSWCRCGRSAGWCSTATPTTSSPRPSRSRSARSTSCPASTSATTRCCRAATSRYLDTQLTRLGGPNFHEIPINAPVAQVHNNQRDGLHRQAIPRGRVAYEPNSLGGGCPFQAGMQRLRARSRSRCSEDKVRGKPEKFADHYNQARLFLRSQTPVEQQHIIARVPLRADARCRRTAVRERIVSMLRQRRRRAGAGRRRRPRHRGAASRMPRALERAAEPEVEVVAGAVAAGAAGRRQRRGAPRRAAGRRRRRRRERCARCTRRWPRPARCRASSARGSARCGRRAASRSTSRSRWRRRRRCCGTRVVLPDGEAAQPALASSARRSSS